MNTTELAKLVSDITGSSEKTTKVMIETILSTIATTIAKGEDVSITGLARFSAVECAPRVGRNPQTGLIMTIPASRKIVFKAGKRMKNALLVKSPPDPTNTDSPRPNRRVSAAADPESGYVES